jgi:hypothetical protein
MYQAIQTHGVEPLCSGPEVAQELFAMMREIGAVSDALKNVKFEEARHDGNALRALVFSNCIAYIAQYQGKTDTISLRWQAYLRTLDDLRLVRAVADEDPAH